MTGQLLSVNIGVPHRTRWATPGVTGIDKRPVAGPVAVSPPGPPGTGAVGLAGDHAYDVRFHGGDQKAVYAYAREDLDWWQQELRRSLSSGTFGENLTTLDVDVSGARIGERWRIGADVVLEVTMARIPCRTFRGWMQEPGWVRRFADRGLPGAYLRVVEPGTVEAGDPVRVDYRPRSAPTVAEDFRTVMPRRG